MGQFVQLFINKALPQEYNKFPISESFLLAYPNSFTLPQKFHQSCWLLDSC